jgi:uncharacterized membrane protein HdeD (DUF308 family)
MVSPNQQDGWAPGPAVVALGILALVAGITISAIFRYSSVDDALKLWTALTGLVGVIAGAFVAYFFTRPAMQAAQVNATNSAQAAKDAEQRASTATTEAQTSQKALSVALGKMTDPAMINDVMQHPVVQRAIQ